MNRSIIVDKTFGYPTEFFEIQQGPREDCESKICVMDYSTGDMGPCGKHVTEKSFQSLKPCVEKCLVDKKDDIQRCCEQQCGFVKASPKGYSECLSSCSTVLTYGGEDQPSATKRWSCSREDGNCQCVESNTGRYLTQNECLGPCQNHPSCSKTQSLNKLQSSKHGQCILL
jgi:hypothetical protein